MRKIAFIPVLVTVIFFVTACKKEHSTAESTLYGVWVKGSSFGDTLWFMKKNGKNIMRMAESFNPGLPNYREKEYRFTDGRLSIQNFAPVSADFYDIDSFTWIQPSSEFKVQGFQLFMFMSSTVTYFNYHKIN